MCTQEKRSTAYNRTTVQRDKQGSEWHVLLHFMKQENFLKEEKYIEGEKVYIEGVKSILKGNKKY